MPVVVAVPKAGLSRINEAQRNTAFNARHIAEKLEHLETMSTVSTAILKCRLQIQRTVANAGIVDDFLRDPVFEVDDGLHRSRLFPGGVDKLDHVIGCRGNLRIASIQSSGCKVRPVQSQRAW